VAFQYRRRTQEVAENRANQQGGGIEGFVKDEYRLFGVKNGDNAIRILPRDASEEAEHFGEDVWVHYSIGPDRASVLCPTRMANEPCPVCEERARVERRGGDDEAIRELRPHRRVLVWLIDRKNEDQGPVLWGMPWTVDRDISKACRDRETGQFYFPEDPEQGYDIYFDRSGNPPKIDYGPFQLSRKPNSVPAPVLDFVSTHPLLETLRVRDYAEIKRLFNGGVANDQRLETAAPPSPPQQEAAGPQRPPLRRDRDEPDEAPPLPKAPPPPPPTPARVPEPVAAQPAVAAISGAERAAALRARFAARKG
jgi:hypothetical protein